jgi:hypothetical protein
MAKGNKSAAVHPAGMSAKPGKNENASAKVPASVVKKPALGPGYNMFKKFNF